MIEKKRLGKESYQKIINQQKVIKKVGGKFSERKQIPAVGIDAQNDV